VRQDVVAGRHGEQMEQLVGAVANHMDPEDLLVSWSTNTFAQATDPAWLLAKNQPVISLVKTLTFNPLAIAASSVSPNVAGATTV
jgi:hypothetical protein